MTVDELKAKIMLHSLKLISDDEISDDYIYEIIKDIKSMDFSMLTLMENMINLRRNAEIFKVWKVSSTYTEALKQMNTLLREVYKAKEILLAHVCCTDLNCDKCPWKSMDCSGIRTSDYIKEAVDVLLS